MSDRTLNDVLWTAYAVIDDSLHGRIDATQPNELAKLESARFLVEKSIAIKWWPQATLPQGGSDE